LERPDLRADVVQQVRTQFRAQMDAPDVAVSTLLVQAQRNLEVLRALSSKEVVPPRIADEEPQWAGEERGRVGEGWPWQK
jgi:hypothetical protein